MEPWKKYSQQTEPAPPEQAGPWGKYGELQPPANIERASILPFAKNLDTGEVSFDPHAGILGAIISGFTAPGDVAAGKLDPNSPEALQRSMDFTMMATPVNPAVRAGDRAIPGVMKALKPGEKPVPTADALREAAEGGFTSARQMGVDYSSDAAKMLADDIQRTLEADGILGELSPKTFSILKKLQSPPEESVASLDGLMAARRALQNAAGDFTNPTEQLAAKRAIESLDDFVMGPSPESVVAGPAAAAAKTLEDARGNYAAAKRSDKITGAEERAELNAAVANSGQNVGNQLRQRIRDILVRPKEARGYSKEELNLMADIARGKYGANLARWVGNVLGGGGGLGATVTGGLGAAAGAAIGGPAGAMIGAAVPPALGVAAKRGSAALTQRQIGKLDELIRKRSPLYQQAQTTMVPVNPEMRAILNRMFMLGMQPEQQ